MSKPSRFIALVCRVLLLGALFPHLLATVLGAAPIVSNVRASQGAGTYLVDVYYDVVAGDGVAPLTVSVFISSDGGASYSVPVFTVKGAVGKGVTAGKDRHIVWNAGADWAGNFTDKCRVKVVAAESFSTPRTAPTPAGMVWIPPGTFLMGSPSTEKDRDLNEGPQTQVTLSQGFWMSQYETTQEEYLAVMRNNPSYFSGDLKRPVEQVTWDDATNYCGKLTVRERAAGRLPVGYVYRLPTEAEWEYCCRAGTTTRFSYGDDPGYTQLGNYGWYRDNSYTTVPPPGVSYEVEGRYYTTHAVGQKRPNAWDLYDMHGQVWGWCLDWWSPSLPGGSVTDPRGPTTGSARVNRGSGWDSAGRTCRSAFRFYDPPFVRSSLIGFRPVLAPVQ